MFVLLQNKQGVIEKHKGIGSEKIIKAVRHDVLTEFTYWETSEARICERTE